MPIRIIERSAVEYAPNLLSKYLLNLASLFNTLYGKERILVEDQKNNKPNHLLFMVKAILAMHEAPGMQIIERSNKLPRTSI